MACAGSNVQTNIAVLEIGDKTGEIADAGKIASRLPTMEKLMPGTVESKLASLGISVPAATAPAANYVPSVISGNMLWISGQIPVVDGKMLTGKLGVDADVEAGKAAARQCAINVIAQIKAALGDLDRVKRVVKLVGFVNSAPDFVDHPKVVNGASDLFVEAFGDAGRHARSAVGVAALPFNVSVEVEAVIEFA